MLIYMERMDDKGMEESRKTIAMLSKKLYFGLKPKSETMVERKEQRSC